VSDPTLDPTEQIPSEVLAEASAAAQAVFDRNLHLHSPNQVFVDQAIAAAGAVFVTALAASIHRRAQLTTSALNIRDQRDALQARLDAAHERLATDDFDQDSCTTLETTIDTVVNSYRAVAASEAAAADRIRNLRAALRGVDSTLRDVVDAGEWVDTAAGVEMVRRHVAAALDADR
jgi:hypothetical protein